jgi:glucoamylase
LRCFDIGVVLPYLARIPICLVWAADFAKQYGEARTADCILVYADWLAAHLEEWTVTTTGELVEGFRCHYIRINPTDPAAPDPHADPNTEVLAIANGGGVQPARNVLADVTFFLIVPQTRPASEFHFT